MCNNRSNLLRNCWSCSPAQSQHEGASLQPSGSIIVAVPVPVSPARSSSVQAAASELGVLCTWS